MAPPVAVPGAPNLAPPNSSLPPGAPAPSEREAFYTKLHAFREETGEPIQRLPTLGFKELDLCVLYREVTKRNGIDSVIANKQWKEVAEALQLPSSCTDSGFRLRLHYKKYLEAFERKFFTPSLPRGILNKQSAHKSHQPESQATSQGRPFDKNAAQSTQQHSHTSTVAVTTTVAVGDTLIDNQDGLSGRADTDVRLVGRLNNPQFNAERSRKDSGGELNLTKRNSVSGSCATSGTAVTVVGEISAGSGSSSGKDSEAKSLESGRKRKSTDLNGTQNSFVPAYHGGATQQLSGAREQCLLRRSHSEEFDNKGRNVGVNYGERKGVESSVLDRKFDVDGRMVKRVKRDCGKSQDVLKAELAGVGKRIPKRTRSSSHPDDSKAGTCKADSGKEKAADSSQESVNLKDCGNGDKLLKFMGCNGDGARENYERGCGRGMRVMDVCSENDRKEGTAPCSLPNGELQTLLEFIQAVRKV